MYVYLKSALNFWTVGFFDPDKKWHADTDHDDREMAARRCNWLNGGDGRKFPHDAAISLPPKKQLRRYRANDRPTG